MHPSMAELFDNLKPGLLWIGADGMVRYANHSASRRTGLDAGRRVAQPALARAVVSASLGQLSRQVAVAAVGQAGRPRAELDCRVIPGLEGDDAFVFVGQADEPDEAAGMDTLMQAIQHDLRDPLRAARAALELARQADQFSGGDALELDALFDRVDHLLQMTDKLVDLAALWNTGSLLADDRIELWPLLQQVWAETEPLAQRRHVRVRFATGQAPRELATLYGSQRWLHRVLTDCLQGAVRAAAPGSELQVELQQTGARARIVLHDTRLFSADGAGTRHDHPIAHRLCRQVLALHGGRLLDEQTGAQRQLVIELPTGAPHGGDEPQLAVAQAQQYARDLAALMNRRRQAGPPDTGAPSTDAT